MKKPETNTTIGTLNSLRASGAGANSGIIQFFVDAPRKRQQFVVQMDAGRRDFISMVKTLFEAMWEEGRVEVTYVPTNELSTKPPNALNVKRL